MSYRLVVSSPRTVVGSNDGWSRGSQLLSSTEYSFHLSTYHQALSDNHLQSCTKKAYAGLPVPDLASSSAVPPFSEALYHVHRYITPHNSSVHVYALEEKLFPILSKPPPNHTFQGLANLHDISPPLLQIEGGSGEIDGLHAPPVLSFDRLRKPNWRVMCERRRRKYLMK